MRVLARLVLLVLVPTSALADIRIADVPVELIVSQVSGRTVRVELSPLDEQGRPRPAPASTVLVPFQLVEKLRIRDLPAAREVQVGEFRLSIKPGPLTFSLSRPDGKLVQECVVDPRDGSIVFRTEAPVFGLGEGRQQFDRRGFFYNFANGQTTFLATHSATIPVPFLIGADGWSMFIHNPPSSARKSAAGQPAVGAI